LIAAVLGFSAVAPVHAADEPTVVRLEFEGLRRVEADAIRLVLTTRRGRPFKASNVAEDIRAIFAMGYFEDVKVYQAKADTSDGVVVIYTVVEKPAVRRVAIEGNDDISTEDIKDVIDIRPFTILNEAKLKRNVQKVKDLYVEKGYYLAEVSHRLDRVSKTEVAIAFVINESAKVQVRRIRFFGNRMIDSDTLRTGLATKEGDLLSFLTDSGTYRADAFQVDLLRISSHYFDNGYINVKLETPDIEISSDRRHLYISVSIDEGEQYYVGKIDFSGDIEGKKELLAGLIETEDGAVFNRSKLGQDLLRIKTHYEDEGYAYANITPVTSIDAEKRTISVTFDVQRGQKVYYERINITGNTKTRDKVIRRELRIYEGDLTSASKRELSRMRVTRLGYFEKVDIKTRKGTTDDLQVIDIEVKERATGTFQIGAGFSSAENFIATAQISQQNFLGRGQSVSLSAQISSIRQLFQLHFTEPYFFDSRWTFSFNAFNRETQLRSFLRSSSGGSLTFGHPITDDIRVFLTYTLEFVESKGGDGLIAQPWYEPLNNEGRISSLRGTLAYDTRNDRLFPSSGMYHSASVEVSDSIFGATENRSFQKYRLFSRFYYPLPWGIVGKLAGRIGYINAVAKEGLSPSEKFIMGGIQTLRGYQPFSIAPERRATRNDRGTRVPDPESSSFVFTEGGTKEVLFNLEFEFPIFEEVGIKGVIFADAGNVFAEEENFFYVDDKVREPQVDNPNFDPRNLPLGMFWSVGFGFRWFSPIGPLRFEWGIPLTPRPDDDRGPLFEFSIGNSF